MTGATPAMGYPYEMVSVGRSDAPAGAETGSEWHRYVIAHGDQRINGCRQGSLAVVTAAVEKIVVQLNDRRLSKGGRTHIVLRGRKPASKE
jgi:hypothetical protein